MSWHCQYNLEYNHVAWLSELTSGHDTNITYCCHHVMLHVAAVGMSLSAFYFPVFIFENTCLKMVARPKHVALCADESLTKIQSCLTVCYSSWATGWTAEGLWFGFGQGEEICVFPKAYRTGPTQFLIHRVPVGSSPG
jgi:hypothetical protein